MINIVARKSASDFHGYFKGDFRSPMWDALGAEECAKMAPSVRAIGKDGWQPWMPFEQSAFEANIDLLVHLERYSERKPVVAVELALSPPKSFSIAALAGLRPDPMLLDAHLSAVDSALWLCSRYFYSRRTRRQELQELELSVARFNHPWNLLEEPHLHTHLAFLREPALGALHPYPFYLHQRAIRAFYHYSLVSRLREAGLEIELGAPGSLLWEMKGIDPDIISLCSERSYAIAEQAARMDSRFSQAVNERVAAWNSRRQLPQTKADMSLVETRKYWHKLVSPERWEPARSEAGGEDFEWGSLGDIFRPSALRTQEHVIAHALAYSLGSALPLPAAITHVIDFLGVEVAAGRLLEGRRNVYCHPETFNAEEEIVEMFRQGWGRGHRFMTMYPPDTKWRRRDNLQTLSDSDDRIRIFSLEGEKWPEGLVLQPRDRGREAPEIMRVPSWNAFQVAEKLKDTKRDVVVVVGGVIHTGDVLEHLLSRGGRYEAPSLDRKRHLEHDGRVIEVLSLSAQSLVSRLLKKLRQGNGNLLYWKRSGGDSQELESQIFQRLGGTRPIYVDLDHEVPFERLADPKKRDPLAIFAVHRCEGFRHRSRWSVVDYDPADETVRLKGLRKSKWVSVAALRGLNDALALVRSVPTPLYPNMQLRIGRSYEGTTPKLQLMEGEILSVGGVNSEGGIVFTDGRVVPPHFRIMNPALVIEKFSPRDPPVSQLIIQEEEALPLIWQELLDLPWQKLTILSRAPSKLKLRLIREIEFLEKERAADQFCRKFGESGTDYESDILGPRSFWRGKIREKNQEQQVVVDEKAKDSESIILTPQDEKSKKKPDRPERDDRPPDVPSPDEMSHG